MAATRKRARQARDSARPYLQRLTEDEELRDNISEAFEAARKAYGRVADGKAPTRVIMEDRKVHRDLRKAATNLREASERLRGRRRRHHWGRLLLVALLGAGLAIALSEDLRKVVLDRLFGAEEEFGYPSTTTPAEETEEAATADSGSEKLEAKQSKRGPERPRFVFGVTPRVSGGSWMPEGRWSRVGAGTPTRGSELVYRAAVTTCLPRRRRGTGPDARLGARVPGDGGSAAGARRAPAWSTSLPAMPSVHVLVPAQRYVFALDGGQAEPQALGSSADGFRRYKELQAEGRIAGMVVFPNTLLIRGERDYLVDPGLIMQGAPVFGALAELGVDPNGIGEVILTHLHFDHVEGLAAWPQRKVWVHRLETEAPYAQLVAGITEMAVLEVLDGEEGEIWPGVRWMLTPGHSDGLVSLLVDTDEGLIVIASDCVGPLPEYFEEMELPQDFGPEREVLLEQWRRIRALDPALVIPGHNPPVRLR